MGGSPNICACGCLRPCGDQLLVNHHYGKTTRKQPQDYRIEDRGYKKPCWVWNLGINKWGYGKVKHEGKTCAAHRYYYEQFVGPIPATLDGNARNSIIFAECADASTLNTPNWSRNPRTSDAGNLERSRQSRRRAFQFCTQKVSLRELSARCLASDKYR